MQATFYTVYKDESWKEDADCYRLPVEWFFLPEGEWSRKDKRREERNLKGLEICDQCQVAEKCLDYALALKIDWGIWGGKTTQERREIKARRKLAARVG